VFAGGWPLYKRGFVGVGVGVGVDDDDKAT